MTDKYIEEYESCYNKALSHSNGSSIFKVAILLIIIFQILAIVFMFVSNKSSFGDETFMNYLSMGVSFLFLNALYFILSASIFARE